MPRRVAQRREKPRKKPDIQVGPKLERPAEPGEYRAHGRVGRPHGVAPEPVKPIRGRPPVIVSPIPQVGPRGWPTPPPGGKAIHGTPVAKPVKPTKEPKRRRPSRRK